MDADAENVEVYQVHILLQGVSPAIWRRVLVRSDSGTGDLNYTIQIAMGWSDDHLNRFLLHGRWCGPWRFMALTDRYTIFDLVGCLEEFLACENEEALGDRREELAHVLEWVDRERFNRREVNQRLQRHASGEEVFALTLG